MKIRLLFPLAGLAISLALPIFGQQTSKPDPLLRQRLVAFLKKFDEAYNNNDSAAVAANFTENAALVTPYGRFWGRDIEQWFAELFKGIQSSNNLFTADEDSPHIVGTAGNELWATGEWSATVKGQSGSLEVKGYWSAIYILEGDDWKIRMLCHNLTLPPTARQRPRRPALAANKLTTNFSTTSHLRTSGGNSFCHRRQGCYWRPLENYSQS